MPARRGTDGRLGWRLLLGLGVLPVAIAGCGAGARLVGGLRLTRAVPAIVKDACGQVRRQRPTIRVVCPRLVPVSNYARLPGLWGGEVFHPTLYAIGFNSGGEAACAIVK